MGQILPLLITGEISIDVATATAGLTTSLTLYNQFSSYLDKGLQEVTQAMLTLQRQMDSLAAEVLQNQWGCSYNGRNGLCLFLREECCFYVSESVIVRNKI